MRVLLVRIVHLTLVTLLIGCATTGALETGVRVNELQFIGSHNSYKLAIDPELLALLGADNPRLAESLDYAHVSLTRQLDLGLRKLELDMFYDPEGGLFAEPEGLQMVANPRAYDQAVMSEPGFKVMHVQDIDFRSNCPLLKQCLQELAAWSDRRPGHTPVVVTINAKDDAIERPGFAIPKRFDASAWSALDKALRQGLGSKLYEPDELRGGAATLPAAIADGWPELDKLRGKFIVVLDHGGAKLSSYINEHPALRGRAMFVNAPRDTPEAAVLIINDPVASFDQIVAAVEDGYLVRTRADADTREARSGDYSRMRRAFASGAQIISTDYYLPEPNFGHQFQVRFPDASYLRCNPSLNPDCGLNAGGAMLQGTAWRLVDFVSMDDAIGRMVPPVGVAYSLQFRPDGSVNMQLNCNRANGSWQAEPNAAGDGGKLEFSPLASTRAFCPPPNMDAQIARDLPYVRSFVIREGKLFLSLFADGGIYQFEPLTEP